MIQEHFLSDIGVAIVGAAALGLPAFFLRIPLLLSYLVAGVVLGPHLGLGIIKDAESIAALSEIGLVLLMFILGLEIDVRKLQQAGKAVLLNGAIQPLVCIILAWFFFSALGYGGESFDLTYLAAACALSSTLVVVKILSDQMDLDVLPSRITLGILVIQDLWAIGFLALQPNLHDLTVSALGISFAKAGILVFSCWIMARFFLPYVFSKAGKQPELMLITAMAWCFAVCGLASGLNLSLEMGALIAGISVASFPYHLDIAAKISSLRDFFITLFFVSLGLQIPKPTVAVIALACAIIIFVLLSRVIVIFPLLHRLKYGNRASLLPALNLSQISEFALVLSALGVAYKHISPDVLSAFIIAMVVSALISSFVIPSAHAIYKAINPLLEKIGFPDHVSPISENEAPKGFPKIVLLGFYREGSSLLFEMQSRYSKSAIENLLVVDFNPEAHVQLQNSGLNCRYGDISSADTLRHLQLHQARLIICTLPDQALKGITNLKLLRILKKLAPDTQVIVTAEKLELAIEMYKEGAAYVFIPRLISTYYLADVVERMQSEGFTSMSVGAMEYLKARKEVIP